MKLLSKMTAVAMSLMMTVGMSSISVKAYDACDVNHDTFVDVSDLVLVYRYLAGDLYVSDYDRLDVNLSQTIDKADAECISAHISLINYSAAFYSRATSSTVAFPTISGNAQLDDDEEEVDARIYKRYSYSSCSELNEYSLTPSSDTISSAMDEPMRAIIDNNESFQHSTGTENTGIVYLSNGCTGFIVGDHIIATAAHCLCRSKKPVNGQSQSTWNNITCITTYNANGTLSTTTLTPIEAHVPKDFFLYGYRLRSSQPTDEYEHLDYGLITVEEDLSSYFHFNLGASYNLEESKFGSVPLYVTGCPSSTQYGQNTDHDLYTQQGSIIDVSLNNFSMNANNRLLYHNIDTRSGNSGSPVFIITKQTKGNNNSYVYTVLGIHDGGFDENAGYSINYNFAARVTKYMLQFYMTNQYLSWQGDD